MSRSIKKVHLRSMSDIANNLAIRKYMIQYSRENDGVLSLKYGTRLDQIVSVDLTSSMSIKSANLPDDIIVKLDVSGKDSDTAIDYIIQNIDGMTLVEE